MYRNPILRNYYAACRRWHALGRTDHCWSARQRAYQVLCLRYGVQRVIRHQPRIVRALDVAQARAREAA